MPLTSSPAGYVMYDSGELLIGFNEENGIVSFPGHVGILYAEIETHFVDFEMRSLQGRRKDMCIGYAVKLWR